LEESWLKAKSIAKQTNKDERLDLEEFCFVLFFNQLKKERKVEVG